MLQVRPWMAVLRSDTDIRHTLNIAMSCLSAFVHPLRLTFVEYFKNSGYEGKGEAYKPFYSSKEINKLKNK